MYKLQYLHADRSWQDSIDDSEARTSKLYRVVNPDGVPIGSPGEYFHTLGRLQRLRRSASPRNR